MIPSAVAENTQKRHPNVDVRSFELAVLAGLCEI